MDSSDPNKSPNSGADEEIRVSRYLRTVSEEELDRQKRESTRSALLVITVILFLIVLLLTSVRSCDASSSRGGGTEAPPAPTVYDPYLRAG